MRIARARFKRKEKGMFWPRMASSPMPSCVALAWARVGAAANGVGAVYRDPRQGHQPPPSLSSSLSMLLFLFKATRASSFIFLALL
eukprot:6299781-Pyramimonas_sp.AAC.1